MTIFLVGISCVGKTSVGRALSEMLDIPFADLDHEVEQHFGTPIERLQQRLGTMDRFRREAAKVLAIVLNSFEGRTCIIALPPSGLMTPYWRTVKQHRGVTVVLEDEPENIINRVTFFDADSRPIATLITPSTRAMYLREIRKDAQYFGRSYRKADIYVDVSGCSIKEAAEAVQTELLKSGKL
jgi:shikimate kinase